MNNFIKKVKPILLESAAGFIFWTGCLTPYMVFVVGVNMEQYLKWFGMQLIITPILAPFCIRFTLWFAKLFSNKKQSDPR